MNLETIISNSLKNDRSAQKLLYQSYKDNLYTIAYRLTGDFTSSNDLLQETFIDAFKNLANLKEQRYFHSWIKQILVRKTYKFLNNKIQNTSLDNISEPVSSDRDGLDIEYIEHAIQRLPFKSRTVFVMAEIEGFSHKEIAKALEITEGTSKSQLHYAKSKLRNSLSKYVTI